VEEIPLIADDAEAMQMIRKLKERGYTGGIVAQAMDQLNAVPVTKVRQRQADRAALDIRIKTEVGRIFATRKINHQGHDLDRKRLGKTNFVVMKSAIDDEANKLVGKGSGERSEFTQTELDAIAGDFAGVVDRATKEVFGV
jgi:hypothetical protein